MSGGWLQTQLTARASLPPVSALRPELSRAAEVERARAGPGNLSLRRVRLHETLGRAQPASVLHSLVTSYKNIPATRSWKLGTHYILCCLEDIENISNITKYLLNLSGRLQSESGCAADCRHQEVSPLLPPPTHIRQQQCYTQLISDSRYHFYCLFISFSVCDKNDENRFLCRHDSGGSIFFRRNDYSAFNVLPKQKINSYHIKVNTLSLQSMNLTVEPSTNCVLCLDGGWM